MTDTRHDVSTTARDAVSEVGAALARLEAIVRRALPIAGHVHGHDGEDRFRGLHLDAAGLSRTLAQPGLDPLFAAGTATPLPASSPDGSRLARLVDACGLTPFDVDVFLVALGPELDLRYERLYAYLQDDITRRRPTVNLALDLLCATAAEKFARRGRFSASAPLLRHRLIEWVEEPHQPDTPLLASSFRPDPQIVRFLLDERGLDRRLSGCASLVTPEITLNGVGLDPDTGDGIAALVVRCASAGEPLTLSFHGADEGRRRAAALAVGTATQREVLQVDVASLAADLTSRLPIVFRDAQLHDAVLVLERWDVLREPAAASAFREFEQALAAHPGIVILSAANPWVPSPSGPRGVMTVAFPRAGYRARRACWQDALTHVRGVDDPALAELLAGRFQLSVDQIWDTVITACRLAQTRLDEDDPAPSADDLMTAARARSGHQLASVAGRIHPAARWGDIVLPDDALAQLREICSRVALRDRVLDEWGFDQRLSYGKGITVLFSGPSGTGKTMAAEIIASELGLDLYRVDLSSVVSKWIGETEKNLDRVFTHAENAILLFDEADALFGKRSEVNDARDRYANVEISYLLQRMESFDGLAILATNVRHHMDEAFMRRLSFVVQFPFPDEEQRRRIWERIWPAEAPVATDVDAGRLARQFRLSGGNVKNIALAAAFAAAERGRAIGLDDVLHGVRREYQKLGKNVSESDLHHGAPVAAGATT